MVVRITVTDVCEVEGAVIANKPTGKTEEELREWRMDVEVVLPCDVVGREFAEMDLVEAITEVLRMS